MRQVAVALMLGVAAPSVAKPSTMSDAEIADGVAIRLNLDREQHGLPPVSRSHLLDEVAEVHIGDLVEHHAEHGRCNMHSWSREGQWTAVCYDGDPAAAPGMWSKPRQLTHGRYPGDGFEIALAATGRITPQRVVELWKHSPEHIEMVREQGMWAGAHWRAMGVATRSGYVVAWFGRVRDLTW